MVLGFAVEDVDEEICLPLNVSPFQRLARELDPPVLECERVVLAQMEERGRESVTRVRTLEFSKGTSTKYWRIEKMAVDC